MCGFNAVYATVLERFVVLMSDQTNWSQTANDAKKVPAICTNWEETLRTSPLYHHTNRVA